MSCALALAAPSLESILWQETPSVYCPLALGIMVSDPAEGCGVPSQLCPLAGSALPIGEQPLVLVEDQLTVKALPVPTVEGLTEIVAVGGGGGSTVTLRGADVAVVCPSATHCTLTL